MNFGGNMKKGYKKIMSLLVILGVLMFSTICFADPLDPNPETKSMKSIPIILEVVEVNKIEEYL